VNKPVHVQAQSKVNSWNTNENLVRKRDNILVRKNQPIYVDTRSKIDTWNDQSTKVAPVIHKTKTFIDVSHVKPTLDTWNEQYQPTKSTNTAEINRTENIDVEAHSTLESWNSSFYTNPRRHRSTSNSQTDKEHRSLSPIFIEPKSTLDTWHSDVIQKPVKTTVIDSSSPIDVRQEKKSLPKRIRPKLLHSPEQSMIREESSMYENSDSPSQNRIHVRQQMRFS